MECNRHTRMPILVNDENSSDKSSAGIELLGGKHSKTCVTPNVYIRVEAKGRRDESQKTTRNNKHVAKRVVKDDAGSF